MPAIIGEADLADRIAAAILGARIGHALGLPLLGQGAREEPEALAPPEGGLPPSDGLAVLLVNLDVVEGLNRPPTCDELAAEWSERVRLVSDEYGPALHSLSLGLRPPVTGWFNNWFLDGSAAMERALLWGCIAPGDPTRAAALACEDALVDHIEDGAHGAMFVAALLSAAFVEAEPKHLLDAAEAVLPPGSRVARAVESVRQGRRGKLAWGECARRVAEAYGHPNYSQAPQNAAYIAMGWLYGETPEDRLARTVSLGGSPQITASVLGALLGILEGTAGLPAAWVEAAAGPITPHPDVDLDAEALTTASLAERLTTLARRALEEEGASVRLGESTDLEAFDPIELVQAEMDPAVHERDPREMILRTGPVDLLINYQGPPSIAAGQSKTLYLGAIRQTDGPEAGELTLTSESRLTVGPARPQPACPGAYFLASARGRRLPRRATLELHVRMEDGVEASGSFPLLGESCWWICGPFEGGTPDDLRKPRGPERDLSESTWYPGRDDTRVRFRKISFAESHMDVERHFEGRPGTIYLVSDWQTPVDMKASIGVASSCGMRAWLDGKPILRQEDEESPLSMRNVGFASVTLRQGTRRLMIKVVRYEKPVELAVFLKDSAGRPLADVGAPEWRALGEMI